MKRRNFVQNSVAIGTGAMIAGGNNLHGKASKSVRLGMIGIGSYGTVVLRTTLTLPGVEVAAVCDIKPERVAQAQRLAKRAGQPEPEGYSRGDEDFRRLIARDDLDGIVITTPWEWHTQMAVVAMKAGKYAAVAVPAAVTIDECWELINTAEETGSHCMLLENACYRRPVMTLLNMVRQGIFGELSHCECGYLHDARYVNFDARGEMLWRADYAIKMNANIYPTHAIGPVAHWLNIDRGNRFDYLTSTGSRSLGMNDYVTKMVGPNHPNALRKYRMSDVNTSVIKCHNGETILIKYDTHLPRPKTFMWMVQGTNGIYMQDVNGVMIEKGEGHLPKWESFDDYQQKYDHPLWKRYGAVADKKGHGGGDYFEMLAFTESIRRSAPVTIDVYDAATWSSIIAISAESVANGSAPVKFPDFTRGKWKTNKPKFGLNDEY
jgi:hypothetical protein